MLISSSKFSTCSSQYIKATQRFDKVSLQRSKIFSKEEVAKSLMNKRIRHIQKELIHLSDNKRLFDLLAHSHYLFYHRSLLQPKNGAFTCQDSASAVVQRNLFNHKVFRDIGSLEEFQSELQDEEEGVFQVGIHGRHFVNHSGEKRVFQGHDFIIVKIIEKNNTAYLIAQSFVKQYSLKSFISKNKMIYCSYDQLNENVLTPLKSILEKKGKWSYEECHKHYRLTGVYPRHLMGFSPPSQNLIGNLQLARSSSFAIEGKKNFPLGKLVEGRFPFPEEWKKIINEVKESANRE